MIVASRATDGKPHRAARDHINPVVNDVVLIFQKPPAQRQETQRRERTFIFAGCEPVGGDLFNQKLVVRFVLVESADDIIAVGVRKSKASLLAANEITLGVSVTRHIQPVSSPAFAIMGRCQQSIHQQRVCIRATIFHEGFNLFRRGR